MSEFFKPWRRKIGVLTLVMALAFMAGWIRSTVIRDVFMFGSGEQTNVHSLVSWRHGLMWSADKSGDSVLRYAPGWASERYEISFSEDFLMEGSDWNVCDWRWRFCGFDFGEAHETDGRGNDGLGIAFWIIPHWSIVIPLTLLSAYLLLSKPRSSTQKKTVEPVPEKVA